MKTRSQIILLLPLVSFLLYAVYFSFSSDDNRSNLLGRWMTTPRQTAIGLSSSVPPLVAASPGAALSAPESLALVASSFTPTSAVVALTSSTPTLVSMATPPAATGSAADAEIADGVFRAGRIIEALEAYARDYGEYPAHLEALLPVYLSEQPVTVTGQPFILRVFSTGDVLVDEVYWLSFRVWHTEHLRCTYLKRLQYWDCNPTGP